MSGTSDRAVTLQPAYDISPVAEDKVQEYKPYKFTPDVKRKVLVALQLGHFPNTAARYAGVSEQTLINWWRRGKDAGPESEGIELELYQFQEDCQEARAKGKIGLVGIIWNHARDDGAIAIKLLEKLYPEDYGTKVKHEVSGEVKHTHSVDYSNLSDEELEQAERLALKAKAQEDVVDAEIIE